MAILTAEPPAPQGFRPIQPTHSGRDHARLVELYRERYGDPQRLELERRRPVPTHPALRLITPAEALANVRRLVLALDGVPPCLTCWQLNRRSHVEDLDRTHYYAPISRGA
jgi:hypothetical protein